MHCIAWASLLNKLQHIRAGAFLGSICHGKRWRNFDATIFCPIKVRSFHSIQPRSSLCPPNSHLQGFHASINCKFGQIGEIHSPAKFAFTRFRNPWKKNHGEPLSATSNINPTVCLSVLRGRGGKIFRATCQRSNLFASLGWYGQWMIPIPFQNRVNQMTCWQPPKPYELLETEKRKVICCYSVSKSCLF